jgi:tetratricopeptide (TPR) repeat protein
MSIESIVRTCNKQAMDSLCSNNYSECYRLLKKAEEIIRSPNYPTNSKLSAVTWNNLGCYYKRINSFDLALNYLTKALETDAESDNLTLAGTHLNILTVLSQQQNHKQALYHGVQAIKLLKNSNKPQTLIVALQHAAEEYILLGDHDKAYSTLLNAVSIADDKFGKDSEFSALLQEKINALGKLEKKFYFEKLNKRATREIFDNFRNNSVLPKVSGPIKPSKSFERSPQIRQRIGKKIRSDRVYVKTAPNKHKMFLNNKSQRNEESYNKLEEKISVLQNQLENFEIRYKKLEQFARNKTQSRGFRKKKILNKNECATLIQKWWRGYRDRKEFRVYRRKMTHERAKRAIEELEILRKVAIKEDLYAVEPRPKTNLPETYRPNFSRQIGTAYTHQRFSVRPC